MSGYQQIDYGPDAESEKTGKAKFCKSILALLEDTNIERASTIIYIMYKMYREQLK